MPAGVRRACGRAGRSAAVADPRRAVAFGAAERHHPDGRDADPGRAASGQARQDEEGLLPAGARREGRGGVPVCHLPPAPAPARPMPPPAREQSGIRAAGCTPGGNSRNGRTATRRWPAGSGSGAGERQGSGAGTEAPDPQGDRLRHLQAGDAGSVPRRPGGATGCQPGGESAAPGQARPAEPAVCPARDGRRACRNTGGLIATCRMQGTHTRTWPADGLVRAGNHPAGRVDGPAPRRWKTLFAGNPMTSDVAQATAGRLHAAARGAAWRLRWRRTVKPAPSGSAGSPVGDRDRDFRPGADTRGDANSPSSGRLARMKTPPCPKPGSLTMVRRGPANTCRRPEAGFPPGRDGTGREPVEGFAHVRRLCLGRMPPSGRPPGHRPPEAEDHPVARFRPDIPARAGRWREAGEGRLARRATRTLSPVLEGLERQLP